MFFVQTMTNCFNIFQNCTFLKLFKHENIYVENGKMWQTKFKLYLRRILKQLRQILLHQIVLFPAFCHRRSVFTLHHLEAQQVRKLASADDIDFNLVILYIKRGNTQFLCDNYYKYSDVCTFIFCKGKVRYPF